LYRRTPGRAADVLPPIACRKDSTAVTRTATGEQTRPAPESAAPRRHIDHGRAATS
jgi:hypothetical protein